MVLIAKKKSLKSKKELRSLTVNCSKVVDDSFMDFDDYKKYMTENIKVHDKKNNFGTEVALSSEGSVLSVESHIAFSKRYLKYLTKKYLKKNHLRDHVRVIAADKNSYELRYPNFKYNEDDDEEEN